MQVKVHTRKTITYKGHFIRKVVDEFKNEIVLIDNPSNVIENAPAYMQPQDYTYASIADAKRFINGEQMVWQPGEVEYLGDKYWNRFKNN